MDNTEEKELDVTDFEDDDPFNDGSQEPDYWYCCGCRTAVGKNPGGWGCPNCGSVMEGEYF